MNTPKILSVQAIEGKRLLIQFANGVEKIYDCSGLLHLEQFAMLNNDAFFKSVQVDVGGYGIFWNDDTDLSEYELWTNSTAIETALI